MIGVDIKSYGSKPVNPTSSIWMCSVDCCSDMWVVFVASRQSIHILKLLLLTTVVSAFHRSAETSLFSLTFMVDAIIIYCSGAIWRNSPSNVVDKSWKFATRDTICLLDCSLVDLKLGLIKTRTKDLISAVWWMICDELLHVMDDRLVYGEILFM